MAGYSLWRRGSGLTHSSMEGGTEGGMARIGAESRRVVHPQSPLPPFSFLPSLGLRSSRVMWAAGAAADAYNRVTPYSRGALRRQRGRVTHSLARSMVGHEAERASKVQCRLRREGGRV